MKTVSIIGMGMTPADMTPAHQDLIHTADVLVGGRRLLDYFIDLSAEKLVIGHDIDSLIDAIKNYMQQKRVVVLASGDPLFYGIGKRLVQEIGADHVTVLPNVSSIATAFSRIKQPWDDATVVSLHGKGRIDSLKNALASATKLGVLTDPAKNPTWLAAWLQENNLVHFDMCVLEKLGDPKEKVSWLEPAQAGDMQFSDPNVVILIRRQSPPKGTFPLYLGMPEEAYIRQDGLITKSEIRAVSIAKLRLTSGLVMWDLGAGSGSVGIEASLLIGSGRIFAVERNPERVSQIQMNQERFKVGNLNVLQADLPEGLGKLPDPDRVFIGGGGKKLTTIVKAAALRLKNSGRIVVNTVLLESVGNTIASLREAGMQTDVTQVQINKGKSMPWGERLAAQNPVWIISGEKR